ncbi:vacuolar ATPase assembly integral membrane protein VMA21 [Egretta garzetta]|nr:vacuolar ATPase assembly integral membrane protein VMA21 [Egretta garzetta]
MTEQRPFTQHQVDDYYVATSTTKEVRKAGRSEKPDLHLSILPDGETTNGATRRIYCDFLLCVTLLIYFRNEGSLTSTLRTLLFFTALMITLPVGLYFSSKAYIFEGTLGMSDRDSYFYAAIVAVVTVHVVLALFVYVAWNEGSRQWREGKQD